MRQRNVIFLIRSDNCVAWVKFFFFCSVYKLVHHEIERKMIGCKSLAVLADARDRDWENNNR